MLLKFPLKSKILRYTNFSEKLRQYSHYLLILFKKSTRKQSQIKKLCFYHIYFNILQCIKHTQTISYYTNKNV